MLHLNLKAHQGDNDKRYKALLKAWDANPNFDFYFSDLSSDEIKSSSVSVVNT
jgi:hypothetical protein